MYTKMHPKEIALPPGENPTGSLSDRVYSDVRRLIVDGEIRAGETISELGLSKQLNVSRTPVREAVKRLLAENLLQTSDRGGLCVYAPTIRDLAEIYYSRGVLEGAAAKLAAVGRNRELIEMLASLIKQGRQCAEARDVAEGAKVNTRFHQVIIEASRSERITALLDGLSPAIRRYRRLSLMFPEHLERSCMEHEEILRLLREEMPDKLEEYVRRHIFRAGARVVQAVYQLEGGDLPKDLPVVKSLLDEQISAKAGA